MTSRYQITLNDDLRERVLRQAEEDGLSFAETVRRTLDCHIGKAETKKDLSIFFDLGISPEPTDVSRDKKKLLGESLTRKAERR